MIWHVKGWFPTIDGIAIDHTVYRRKTDARAEAGRIVGLLSCGRATEPEYVEVSGEIYPELYVCLGD